MKKLYLLFFMSLTIFSCQERTEDKVNRKALELIKQDDKYIALDGIFEDFHVVPFENNRQCMLGDVRRLFIRNDKVYVYDQNGAPGIYRFNMDGSFDKRIGAIGHGKDEYVYVEDVAVDKRGNVAVLSALDKIQIYNSECEYEKTIELSADMGLKNIVYADGVYVGAAEHSDYSGYDDHLLYFFDEDFNLIGKKLERIRKDFTTPPMVNTPLDSENEKCCFFDFYRNQFVVISKENMETHDVYEVKTKNTYDLDDVLNGIFENAEAVCDILTDEYICDDKLLGWMIYDNRRCFFEYDMDSDVAQVYSYLGLTPSVLFHDKDYYYAVFDAEQLMSFMEECKESDCDNAFYQALLKCNSNISMLDNLYLVRMKHKIKITTLSFE